MVFWMEESFVATVTLTNNLGKGLHPHLTLVLSAPPGKPACDINYRGTKNMPWSSDGPNWLSWNVFDEDKKYYGTITLKWDGVTVSFDNYNKEKADDKEKANEYRLKNIHFTNQGSAYQLTVEAIIEPSPFLNIPLATPAVYPGTDRPIWLSTAKDKIKNDQGNVVVLKGVARPSLEWNRQGQYLSQTDIEAMRKWGANVVRIALNQAFWLDSDSRESMGSYKQIVDAIIYHAIQQKMAVILDLHIIKDHQENMANKASIDFWRDVATTYANFGTVLLELYNEPNDITYDQWRNGGGTPARNEGPYVGYQQLYDAVRATGAKNICVVAGTRWGYDLSFVNSGFRVQGDNIVYCAHPWYPRGDKQKDPLEKNFKGLIGEYPIIFTEFGRNAYGGPYDPKWYKYLISYMNEHGFHYTGWGWWVEVEPSKAQDWPCLIGNWTNWTPIDGGQFIHDDLQRNPGTKLG
jgi:hypothetical protein